MSACCVAALKARSLVLAGLGGLSNGGSARRLPRRFHRGFWCKNVMPVHSFTGRIPECMDPETTGVPFEDADSRFGEPLLLTYVSTYYPDRIYEIGNLSFSDVLTRKPQTVQSKWWSWRDVAMPFLLRLLIGGEIRAFGASDRADAFPVWIPPRLWKDLQPDLDNKRCFSGAGATYWNVRVVDPHTFASSLTFPAATNQTSAHRSDKRAPAFKYWASDDVIVSEMRKLIDSGRARGRKEAASMLVDRAEGKGMDESKIKRLIARYNETAV